MQVSFVESITEVDAQTWNTLVSNESPFLKHEFLLALEQTGCTIRATGWQPHHAIVCHSEADTSVVAVSPLYLKFNSFGEYVFDWSWADAFGKAGVNYYPKFLTAIPFTPCASSRILHDENVSQNAVLDALKLAIQSVAEQTGVSSWHVLFPTQAESEALGKHGMSRRKGCQFHWFNRGYQDFDDYLQALNSRKRKNIRKERRSVTGQGIQFETIEGPDITERQWKHFYDFYQSTYLVRGREGYLNQEFFLQVGRTMPKNLVLILAKVGSQPIAGALFFKGGSRLYGRYWGSMEEYQFLHFETCFYQGIDYCIRHGLQQFDAGAQGERKIQRGFEPIETWSNHWISNANFSSAINDFLKQESRYVGSYMAEAEKLLPFKKPSS
ncbi:MAG: N-acetyltransferase [Gammaproteobacteria bacterium]|nr:N-acetyltransferase [Gammaproteobacteria bacterium]